MLPALGHLRLADLTRRHIADLLHHKLGAAKRKGGNGTTANRLRSLLQRLFNKGIEWGYLETNPVERVRKVVDETSRARVLTDAELALLWHEIGKLTDARTRRCLQLLALTGQRVSEVAGMTRAELDLDAKTWTIPVSRAKNGHEHVVPLAAPALEVVRAALDDSTGFEHLFPNPANKRGPHLHRHTIEQAWRRLCRREDVKISGATPHDLRRTMTTWLAGVGRVQPHVVYALLNHISSFRGGVAGIYNRAQYEREKRDALDMWATHVIGLTAAQIGSRLSGGGR